MNTFTRNCICDSIDHSTCFRYHMPGQVQPPSVMPTFMWADSPKPWARKTWSSCSPSMVASSRPASLWTKLQVRPFNKTDHLKPSRHTNTKVVTPILCILFSEQAYHGEWASSGLTSEMKQRRPSKDWTGRSLWVPLSQSQSSLPTTQARKQARPYWLSCTKLLPVATRDPCTTRLNVSGTESSPTPPWTPPHLKISTSFIVLLLL